MKLFNSAIFNFFIGNIPELPGDLQYFFQDPASPVMEGIINLHNYIFFYLIIILVFVLYMIYNILIAYSKNIVRPKRPNHVFFRAEVLRNIGVVHGTTLEIIWTVIPSLILIFIAVPSFALLYAMDEIIHPTLTVKAIGYQWYWAYEYSDYTLFKSARKKTIAFDSYMIDENDLSFGDLRLLEVDNETVLPINTHIRILLSAADVLHSWAVPALGVKTDAVPGRVNQIPVYIRREGIFYGQCSELCGVNHGFMPIVVKAVSLKNYLNWINMNYGFK